MYIYNNNNKTMKLGGLIFIAWYSFGAFIIASTNGPNADAIENSIAECERFCTTVSMKAKNDACMAELKALPKPKLGDLCKNAFASGYKKACNDECHAMGNSEPLNYDSFGAERREICASATRMSPRPACRDACQSGFDTGVIAGLSAVRAAFIQEESSHNVRVEEPLLDAFVDLLIEGGETDVEEIVPIVEVIEFSFEQLQPADIEKSFESDIQDGEQSVGKRPWEQHDNEALNESPVLEWSPSEPEEEMASKLNVETIPPPIQEKDPKTLDSHVEILNDAYVIEE